MEATMLWTAATEMTSRLLVSH